MKVSKFISYFFHPINLSIIGSILYFMFVPKFIFKPNEYTILVIIFIGTYVFPLVLLALLKRFGMIESYQMHTIEERKFPIILFISISYIIGNWLFKSTVVDVLSLLFFGSGLFLVFTYLLFYAKLKISLHTAAIGGLIGFLICFSHYYRINLVHILAILFVLSGIIASSRLRLKAHKLNEVVIGFLLSLGTQIFVYLIYLYII